MVLKTLLVNDVKFQWRYGFYAVYAIISLVYIGLLMAVDPAYRGILGTFVIFSDPAALGVFFMGSIVLYEKSDRVLSALFVSPMTARLYTLSKLISLSVISTLVALLLALPILQGGSTVVWLELIASVFLGSALFSAIGLIAAANALSLNRFLMRVLPLGFLAGLPAVLVFFGDYSAYVWWHPGAVMLKALTHALDGRLLDLVIEAPSPSSWAALCMWLVLGVAAAERSVLKMARQLGGIKL